MASVADFGREMLIALLRERLGEVSKSSGFSDSQDQLLPNGENSIDDSEVILGEDSLVDSNEELSGNSINCNASETGLADFVVSDVRSLPTYTVEDSLEFCGIGGSVASKHETDSTSIDQGTDGLCGSDSLIIV